MKKFIAICLILLNIQATYASSDSKKTDLKKFIITAYYSPLPDQSIYLKGNYKDEVILNGAGIRGASGKGVYPGMLAAPKTYSFGTKIYLSGIGVGTVDDRGGAIVGSGSRGYDGDRLDIWMGYGEEGLKRALTWGKRTVYGKIINESENKNYDDLNLEKFKIGKVSLSKVKVTPTENIVPESIGKNSKTEDIKKAQEIFAKLGFYNGVIDGIYNKLLIDAIADFQISSDLLQSSFSSSAGSYGPKTKAKLKEKYLAYLKNQEISKKEEAKKQKELAIKQEEAKKIVNTFGTPKTGEVGNHVRNLQKTMKALGYFQDKETAIFGPKTKESIINYQLKNGIIKSKNDIDAGIIGEKTQKFLQNDLIKYFMNNKDKVS